MTLQQLEYIVALDTYRHFVTAAEKTFVTQPTLTMQVKKLEEEMGIVIFDRKKNPLEPTKIGKAVISKARDILRESCALQAIVAQQQDNMEGSFRLGVIPTISPYLLPKFLPGFLAEFETTNLQIKEMQTDAILAALKNDSIDIGILAGPVEDAAIREISLYFEPFLLYVSQNDALAQEQNISASNLDSQELLLLTEGHCLRNQIVSFCNRPKFSQHFHFEFESGSIEALKGMVESGLGYTLVPELAITAQEKGISKRFIAPEPVREICLVTHNSFPKEKLLANLIFHIQKSIPTEFKQLENRRIMRWK